jgi:hypothetical protein
MRAMSRVVVWMCGEEVLNLGAPLLSAIEMHSGAVASNDGSRNEEGQWLRILSEGCCRQ